MPDDPFEGFVDYEPEDRRESLPGYLVWYMREFFRNSCIPSRVPAPAVMGVETIVYTHPYPEESE